MIDEFVGKCIRELIESGVNVEFIHRSRRSKYGYNYFSDGSDPMFGSVPSLRLNIYRPDWEEEIQIFIHEYCHFLQWKEGIPLWRAANIAGNAFDAWLNGKIDDFPKELLRPIQLLELDCDRRAVELIKQNNLPIDVNRYTRESNAYVLSYHLIYKYRKFFIYSGAYTEEVAAMMPSEHLSDDEIDMDIPGFEEAFMKYV